MEILMAHFDRFVLHKKKRSKVETTGIQTLNNSKTHRIGRGLKGQLSLLLSLLPVIVFRLFFGVQYSADVKATTNR
jgi:hypothetical protein